jgi:RepB DNA-primase from phage plasmid
VVAVTDVIPQQEARMLQLAMIRGNEPRGALLELRYRRPEGTVRRADFYDAYDLDRISAEIDRLAAYGDVWVSAAPRVCRDGTAAGVARVPCLWADLDGLDALLRLSAFPSPPSMIVHSGSEHCAHAYWQLRTPLTPADAQRANRRLALALGADMAATDPARILRAAGTLNWKHDPPREVRCVRLELDSYDARELVGGLPDSHHYAQRRQRTPAPVGDAGRVLDGLARVVRTAEVGNRNHSLFWAACRVVDHAGTREIDEAAALQELRAAAQDAGLPDHEISATIASATRTPQKAAA